TLLNYQRDIIKTLQVNGELVNDFSTLTATAANDDGEAI
ncbi:hypothetical protein pipiens_017653, partial [Culex pipiens pipiens]